MVLFERYSNKYHRNNFFSYHIPEIRIVTVEPLRAGKTCELILRFTNPTQHQTVITLLKINHDDDDDLKSDNEQDITSEIANDFEQKLSVHEVCKYSY